ncbi:Cysteine proteinases superfamily protein [Perilla frutescens var. frutescens]|nr:Cysteine proteinases superfamily protein [Perilla frutescens var. frutescens]
MKKLLLLLLLALLAMGAAVGSFEFHELQGEKNLWELYESWILHHNLSRSIDVKLSRFEAFYVDSANRRVKPYTVALNDFADMTNREFNRAYADCIVEHDPPENHTSSAVFIGKNLEGVPNSVDWRDEGVVLPVGLQEGILLGILMPVTPPRPRLWSEKAGPWLFHIVLYHLRCQLHGVFVGLCGTDINHQVTIVGYGTTLTETNYWIIKNSWRTNWREQDYMRMEREAGGVGGKGLCGIAMALRFPTKAWALEE